MENDERHAGVSYIQSRNAAPRSDHEHMEARQPMCTHIPCILTSVTEYRLSCPKIRIAPD